MLKHQTDTLRIKLKIVKKLVLPHTYIIIQMIFLKKNYVRLLDLTKNIMTASLCNYHSHLISAH